MPDFNKQIPNLFIAGAPKCGTSAFSKGLAQHPDIYVGKKEPRYFDAPVYFDIQNDYPHKSLESYLALYSSKESIEAKYRVDASVFNMYNPKGIQQILKMEPRAKFLIILRDPTQAAQSMHAQRLKYTDKAMRELSENFLDCWALMEKRRKGKGFPEGCKNRNLFRYDYLYDYGVHLEALKVLIPKSQLLIIDYEVYKSDSSFIYEEVFHFLGLEKIRVETEIVNPSFSAKMSLRNKFIFLIQRLLIRLPFRPKRLVSIAKRIIGIAVAKKQVKRLDGEELVDVESFFYSSKRAMKEALKQYGVNKRGQ